MSIANARLALAGPDIIFEDFDGDLVVLNLRSGEYFGFNPAAAVVWEAFMAGCAPETVAGSCSQDGAIDAFAQRLLELGLVKTSGGAGEAPSDAVRDRLAGLDEAPTVEVYDDLADLIAADPIHDVDQEAGWPRMPVQ